MKINARRQYEIVFKENSVKYNDYLMYFYRLTKRHFLVMFCDFLFTVEIE